jgi:hypothetical protein
MRPNEASVQSRIRQAVGDFPCAGAVADAVIDAAEEELGLRFPVSYRIFLSCFGSAWLAPYEIAGLGGGRHTGPEPPRWQHVVDATVLLRRALGGGIPVEYVAISDDGGDYKFYLDTGNLNALGEAPVIVLGPGRDAVVIAASFVEFIERAATGQLSF